jgi:hypothetical protein
MEKEKKMDNLMIFSTLNILRIGFSEMPPFEDKDLRALYTAKLAESPAVPRLRVRIANGFATLLERAAAGLRQPVDESAGRPSHA